MINEGSALSFLDHSLSSMCEMVPSLGRIRAAFIMLFLVRKIGLLQLQMGDRELAVELEWQIRLLRHDSCLVSHAFWFGV